MIRFLRTILKILGALMLVLLLLLVWSLRRVDHSPYFESRYYEKTRSRLDHLGQQLSLAQGPVELGFGKAGITPMIDAAEDDPATGAFRAIPLAGYGDRKGVPAEGVHDSLFIKAVAIRVKDQLMVLVGSDLLIVPPNVAERVSKKVRSELGLERNQLFFSATHTHSGPGAWFEGFVGKAFAGESNPAVVDWLVQQFGLAIEASVADLQEGALGTGSFHAPDLVRNRLVGEHGIENSEFLYMVARQHAGRTAILGTFDGHSTTLGGWNLHFSGDYPGYWQRKLEQEGADMAVFHAGSMGSHSAVSQGDRFERPRYIGEILADSVSASMPGTALRDSIGLSFLSLEMDLPGLQVRLTDGLGLNKHLSRSLLRPEGRVYLQAARIGDLLWITTPCDFSGEMAVDYKNAMARKKYKTVVTSFNGNYTGYIIPGKYFHLKEYESRLMSWYGPSMGPYTAELIRRMLDQLVSL